MISGGGRFALSNDLIKTLELIPGMEWDAKVALLDALVDAMGRDFVQSFVLDKAEPAHFENSKQYWDDRYRSRGTSGPGSYGHLAQFKADVLNQFVREHGVTTVIEFGCGDGNQLTLANYPDYIGVDVSATAVALCQMRFNGDRGKRFYIAAQLPPLPPRDLSLSLDVIYHLVEDDVFESYMSQLFDSSSRYVVIYASNKDEHGPAAHVRHRAFTQWVADHRQEWTLVETIRNRFPYNPGDPENTSFADFYIFERQPPLPGD